MCGLHAVTCRWGLSPSAAHTGKPKCFLRTCDGRYDTYVWQVKSITANVPLNANWVFGSKITWFIPRSRSAVISVFNHQRKMNISDSLFIALFWPFKVPVPKPLPFSAPWMLNEFQLKVLQVHIQAIKEKEEEEKWEKRNLKSMSPQLPGLVADTASLFFLPLAKCWQIC